MFAGSDMSFREVRRILLGTQEMAEDDFIYSTEHARLEEFNTPRFIDNLPSISMSDMILPFDHLIDNPVLSDALVTIRGFKLGRTTNSVDGHYIWITSCNIT
jgi:hypothetical protein